MQGKIHTPPGDVLLDRKGVPNWISENLAEQVSYLEELTDYGVQLLKRSFLASKREIPDVVLLPVLFKQVLAFLDAVHLHLVNGATYTAIPDLRSMYEATLSLEWILKGPQNRKEDREAWKERWGRQFYVSELRQERSWNQAFVSRSLADPEKVKAAKQQVNEIDQHLAKNPELKRISATFDPLVKKPGQEPAWYRPSGGPSSIGDMARQLGRADEYQVLYRSWSEVSHGSRVKPHIQILSEGGLIEPIRSVDGLAQALSVAGSIAERAIGLILEECRPDELKQFAEKRATEWKAKRQIPEIKVETQLVDMV